MQASSKEDRLANNIFTSADAGMPTTFDTLRATNESTCNESTPDASVRSYNKVNPGLIGLQAEYNPLYLGIKDDN